ncbi:Gfo/Idh/MocA family oxidoreductase [Thermostilla marina]
MKRRRFLKTAVAGLAGVSMLRGIGTAWAAEPVKRVALIGSGWYGKSALLRFIQVAPVEVVGLCDVDRKMLDDAVELVASRQESGKRPPAYHDFRQMLSEQRPEIVLVSTPDHWHALAMIEAVKAGADVYEEKPVSVDVVEGQAMLAAARKYGRVVQVNTQRRSTPHLIEARDRVIREGLLGKVGHVEMYCYYHMRARGNPPNSPPPPHLDWDMWSGPAPLRPYNELIHPRRWRSFKEYGNGILGDMCIHMLDTVRWMLDLKWPKRISSHGGIFVDKTSIANVPDTQTAVFEFDDLTAVWQHRTWGHPVDPDYPWGATLYGEKGTLKISVHRYDFQPYGNGTPLHGDVLYELEEYPEDKTEKDLEKHVAPAMRRHIRNFLDNVASRGRPVADIEEGFISSASCILANLSLELGRSLTWDAERQQVVGDEEANARLARPYREPWVHPTPANV